MKQNHTLLAQLKEEILNKINSLEKGLEENHITLQKIDTNMLELVFKVTPDTNEDLSFFSELDHESDNNGGEYFIQL